MSETPDQNTSPQHALNHLFRWQFASSLYMSLLQLASLVFLGQFLGYKEMGIYTIFQIVFRLAMALLDPGMFVSVIQKTGFNRQILNKLKSIQYILLCICIGLLLGFYLWEYNYLISYPYVVIISLVLFSTIGIGSMYPSLLQHHLKQKQISLFLILSGTIEFIWIILAIWYVDPILVFCIGLFLRFSIFYSLSWLYSKMLVYKERIDESVQEHVSFSSYQVLNQGISFVQGNFDTVLVGSVFGLLVLGPYNIASEFSYLLFSKINPIFNKAIFPLLAKYQKDVKHRQEIIKESLLSHALVCITIYLIVYSHLSDIIPLLFKDPEYSILQFSKFIVIMAMIRSVNNIVFNQLLALGESSRLLKWNIAVLIINYVFIALVYWTQTDIYKFLLINIFLSFSVLVYSIHRLLSYFEDVHLFYKALIKYMIYLTCCCIVLFLIHMMNPKFISSLLCGVAGLFSINFIFYRDKIFELFRLKIM
ncbi:MAG: oligosaccharide flippase family protein [Saprospiraceae bacterium]|nr:oligosaccharide flippase family protein [Saprospiraceae bacterium]MBK7738232.1 oligosaccharide flippase family protein [Saprospiraceae bacterium]MBK7913194.1 oligosaccharide flippase family protein [Saprospiraceae bacterium]